MKRYLIAFSAVIAAFLFSAGTSYAFTTFLSGQVGTSATNGYVLQTNGTNSTWVATSTLGISGSGGSPYPFPLTGNATSTLTQFNGGLTAYATSTVGNGSVTGGLTVSGSATTTGSMLVGNSFSSNGGTGVGILNVSGAVYSPGGYNVPGLTTYGSHTIYNSATLNFNQNTSQLGNVQYTTMTLLNNGSLGIGSTTPSATLAVTTGGALGYTSLAPSTAFLISSSTQGTATTSLFDVLSSGNVGIGTSSPFAPLSVVGTVYQNGTYFHSGNAVSSVPCNTISASCLEQVGNDNTFLGVTINVENINAGNLAYSGVNLLNDLKGTATTNYSGIYQNSSVYNDPANTFGSLNNVPNLLQLGNSMGPVSIQSFAPTQAGSYINFYAGSTTPGLGPASSGEGMRLTSTGLGIGTTSPLARLDVAGANNGTAPLFQLSSVASFATTTQFIVTNAGNVGIGTTSPGATLGIQGSIGVNASQLYLGANGFVGIGTSAQTGAKEQLTVKNNTTAGSFLMAFFNGSNNGAYFVQTGTSANYNNYGAPLNSTVIAADYIGRGSYGPLALAAGGLTRLTIDNATGNVGIGTTSPWRTLAVTGTVGFDGLTTSAGLQTGVLCLSANKEVINDSVACLASAKRFKQDITPLQATSSLAELMAINPVSYEYKPSFNGALQSNPNWSGQFKGFIADDIGKIDPTLIEVETATSTNPNDPSLNSYPGMAAGLKIDNIVAVLWSSTQQIADNQSDDEKKIAKLEAEVQALQNGQQVDICRMN